MKLPNCPAVRVWACVSATLAVSALILTDGASAQTAPTHVVLGTDGHGVHVDQRNGIVFTYDPSAAKRYKRIAGRLVITNCDNVSRSSPDGLILDTGGGGVEIRAPRHRAPIVDGDLTRADFCTLALPVSGDKERVVATVPLSAVGVEYLDQRRVARGVLAVVAVPAPFRDRLLRALGAVQLTSQQTIPPAGKLGVYVSGEHLYAAERDQAGLLLFWQIDGPVSRTNMILFVTDPIMLGPNARGIQRRE